MIAADGREWRTNADAIHINEKTVARIYCNGVQVYPDDGIAIKLVPLRYSISPRYSWTNPDPRYNVTLDFGTYDHTKVEVSCIEEEKDARNEEYVRKLMKAMTLYLTQYELRPGEKYVYIAAPWARHAWVMTLSFTNPKVTLLTRLEYGPRFVPYIEPSDYPGISFKWVPESASDPTNLILW